MDKKTMKLLKRFLSDEPEKIEAVKEAVKKEVSKSVTEGEKQENESERCIKKYSV